MARKKTQLSEQEQKIIVQAQLMGLTVENMTRIANRLRAIEKEKHTTAWIQDTVTGVTWKDLSEEVNGYVTCEKWQVFDNNSDRSAIYTRNLGHYNWRVQTFKGDTKQNEFRASIYEHTIKLYKRQCPEESPNLVLAINHFKKSVLGA